ncbi:hypothetical protein N0V88_005562 [Collariella sp. IMI 366227]|nr:hypothetical protein N0V88_005562 [Collariella sp. IMI 366227]
MFECGTCDKVFPAGWRARKQHCEATGHEIPDFECDSCDAYFSSEQARQRHMRAKGHFDCYSVQESPDWECHCCDDWFWTEQECIDHMVVNHLYCSDCNRYFMNYNNIKQHLNSKIHRGSTISCPFCSTTYTTAAGMTHHLERGACPRAPNLNRDEIYRFVRSKDPNGLISKHAITWESTTYSATGHAWNGSCYECYFCRRGFGSLTALNQHLNSPAHQKALYHCPKPGCRTEFKTLGAIINHLESESCGAMRFETVQRRIGDIVSGNRLIRF